MQLGRRYRSRRSGHFTTNRERRDGAWLTSPGSRARGTTPREDRIPWSRTARLATPAWLAAAGLAGARLVGGSPGISGPHFDGRGNGRSDRLSDPELGRGAEEKAAAPDAYATPLRSATAASIRSAIRRPVNPTSSCSSLGAPWVT